MDFQLISAYPAGFGESISGQISHSGLLPAEIPVVFPQELHIQQMGYPWRIVTYQDLYVLNCTSFVWRPVYFLKVIKSRP